MIYIRDIIFSSLFRELEEAKSSNQISYLDGEEEKKKSAESAQHQLFSLLLRYPFFIVIEHIRTAA